MRSFELEEAVVLAGSYGASYFDGLGLVGPGVQIAMINVKAAAKSTFFSRLVLPSIS